jgi:hypothetical protein
VPDRDEVDLGTSPGPRFPEEDTYEGGWAAAAAAAAERRRQRIREVDERQPDGVILCARGPITDEDRRVVDSFRAFLAAPRHDLKTWPDSFEDVLAGAKRFEVRKDDRDYAVGDVLILREYEPDTRSVDPETQVEVPGRYTGRVVARAVTYLMRGGRFGIEHGYVVLGLEEVPGV